MDYIVTTWTRKPDGPDIAPGAIAFRGEIDCGHVVEAHGFEGQYGLPTTVKCGVCGIYAEMAEELEAELAMPGESESTTMGAA